MAYIWEINERIKVTKTNPKPIQNQLKNKTELKSEQNAGIKDKE